MSSDPHKIKAKHRKTPAAFKAQPRRTGGPTRANCLNQAISLIDLLDRSACLRESSSDSFGDIPRLVLDKLSEPGRNVCLSYVDVVAC